MRSFFFALACLVSLPSQAAPLVAYTPQPEGHPTTVALAGFIERVQATTGSEAARYVPIDDGKEQGKFLDRIRKGEIKVAVISGSMVGRIDPMANVMRLPFILRNTRQMFGLLEGQLGQDMVRKLDAAGLVHLGWYDGGTRAIYSQTKLGSVGAMKDVKIRIPARKDLSELITSLGGTPLQLPYKDVNSSFESHKIDAAENDLMSYESEGHYKRAPYFYIGNSHIVQFEALVVSKAWWNSLSEAQRATLAKAGADSAKTDRDIWTERQTKARSRLEKEGVKFLDYGDSSILLSRVSNIYRPFMNDPATRDLIVKLMTARI